MNRAAKVGCLIYILAATGLFAITYYVSPSAAAGGTGSASKPFKTIQAAVNNAVAGDTILAKGGRYRERIEIRRSGAKGALITIKAAPGEKPAIDLGGVPGKHGFYLYNKSYIRIEGLEIKNNRDVNDGSLIRIEGYGDGIEIVNNLLHTTRGKHAMAITAYGEHGTKPINDLLISGNWIQDIQAATSEALTLNGNVTNFKVLNNTLSDINNIGIDFIGGEGICPNKENDVARNGICKGNIVSRANSNYGGGYAAGIYVDGGRDILIEENTVEESDLGIEVGAENKGIVATGIAVRGNKVINNDKVGIIFGGYDSSVGRVRNCEFLGNTVTNNDTFKTGLGQLCIQFADHNRIEENTFTAQPGTPFYYSEKGNVDNTSNRNTFRSSTPAAKAIFVWMNKEFQGFAKYQTGAKQDGASTYKQLP